MGIKRSIGVGLATAICIGAFGAGAAHASVINGTDGDDTLTGTRGNDRIFALAGNDDITTGVGADYVAGGQGDDYITDGRGTAGDRFYGGKGDDSIIASGPDKLYGGPGKDVFNLSRYTHKTFVDCGAGHDTVFYTIRGKRPPMKNCERLVFVDA